ncbi:hypothetical protein [Mongoliimonas terrestris]|uniref:hypothetical protein n=1 Tax=Mongoliimonas terrestris TaxID=1709001 RepID=UPI0009496F5A|nr:hypothetical protein [Mongoliimonas terrestris]
MKTRFILPILATFALVACDEQTAEAPTQPESEVAVVDETAPAADPAVPSATGPAEVPDTAITPPAATGTTDQQTAATDPAVTGPAATGAVGTTGIDAASLAGAYTAGPVAMQLEADGTFSFEEIQGQDRVEGTYLVQGDEIVFSNPAGNATGAQFPIRCRLVPGANGFTLQQAEGACGPFADLAFERAG